MTEPVINERAQTLLKCLVERYIRDGQPVGSRTLSKEMELGLSPATVRNVMSDLERVVKEAEILKWAEENRSCKLTDAPHWIVMALMEDIVYFDCHV